MQGCEKFENFVSLGTACQVAAVLRKYGLRSWSGVFDWLVTMNLQWVLHYMENDFDDFMRKENLESYRGNLRQFVDTRSGFLFTHDECLFATEYEELKCKYQKKIDKFLSETAKKTCFLRVIETNEEIAYIKNNVDYINRVIRKNNTDNQIVFLVCMGEECSKSISDEIAELPFTFFEIKKRWCSESMDKLSSWLDDEWKFIDFCVEHYDEKKLVRNIKFAYQYREKEKQIVEERYNNLLGLLQIDWNKVNLPPKVIIYGAGNIGKALYHAIEARVEVVAFVVKYNAGRVLEGVPVIDLSEIVKYSGYLCIVTATYDFENICNDIKRYDETVQIISLKDIGLK